MAESKQKNFAERMIGNIKSGDRMIWIVAVMLMLLSLVAIFSSTSSHAIRTGISRTVIFSGQLGLVAAGVLILVLMSAIPNIKYIKALSRLGFLVSLVLLAILAFDVHLGSMVYAINKNEASRAIYIFGFTLQVYEVVKVAMVMYLSWALQAYESNSLYFANKWGTRYPEYLGWMKSAGAQRLIYIYLPMLITMGLTFPGSTSSALMLGIVMGVTLIIGGLKFKHLLEIMVLGITGIMILVGVHIISSGKVISRMQTGFNRLGIELPYPDAEVKAKQKAKIAARKIDPEKVFDADSPEFAEYRNKTLQNNSAELAFVQGGRRILGKGPGKSTQKYIVPLIFEDYMFSFLMEEYGLFGCILVIALYLSLFARGWIIVTNCSNRFAKSCVGGLVFLITFQAMFHILINCNVGILTGQTLPMISHGKSSFLCFTLAFGIILSVSKLANNKIKKEREHEQEMLAADEITSNLQTVESIDSQLEAMENGEDLLSEEEKNDINDL